MDSQVCTIVILLAIYPAYIVYLFLRPSSKAQKFRRLRYCLAALGALLIPLAALYKVYDQIQHPPHYRLSEEPSSCNHIYRQLKEPTPKEVQAGWRALKLWKSASDEQKNEFADDIVLSKVLIGMTQKEIVSYMGAPDAPLLSPDISPEIKMTGYNACCGESQCDLTIELENKGKASDVYLDVNY